VPAQMATPSQQMTRNTLDNGASGAGMGARMSQAVPRLQSGKPVRILRDDLPRHATMHVGEAEIADRIAVDQPLVIEAHEAQQRGVQGVDVDRVSVAHIRNTSLAPYVVPPRMAPPASSVENAV
jgi:hypothetical protein